MTDPRTYEVVALTVPIVHNEHGDHDRFGTVFAPARHADELRAIGRAWPDPGRDPDAVPLPHPLVRPLVLRARVGERVVVHFRNELPRRAGIHPSGVRYDVERADGGVVGFNPDSAAEPDGGRRSYTWECDREGVFFFGDLADLRGGGLGAQAHGLFGALVVEPDGAVWTDPETGATAEGPDADVHVPGAPSFREHVLFLQDGAPNDNPVPPRAGYRCERRDPHTHAPAAGGGLLLPDPAGPDGDDDGGGDGDGTGRATLASYRSEPAGRRTAVYRRLVEAGVLDPEHDAVADGEQRHSSWLFGDPATPVLRAYAGDRTRIRVVNAGVAETHVVHLHLHRWRAEPGGPLVDTAGVGPQQALTIEPVGGAGPAVGDTIWQAYGAHCGVWGIRRVFDVAQDGSRRYPDGTPIAALRPLPGHPPPPAPTADRPGFPAFLPGVHPQRSPRPPRTPSMPRGQGREPTDLERRAFCANPRPGEAFTKVAPDDAPVRRYDLVVLQGTIRYCADRHGGPDRRDDDGVLYVPAADVAAAGGVEAYRAQLASGDRTAEPVVLRAAAGDVVELTLTNALPPGCRASTAFDAALPFQPECGLHPHLVGLDPLVSDGAAVGWNYLSGTTTADAGRTDANRYRTWTYRWYCDEELGTVVFHDRLGPDERRRHGLYGCLVVEPGGARWTDPHEPGRAAGTAARAVVTLPDGTAFREQVLALADHVPMTVHGRDGGAEPVGPPSHPGAGDGHGGLAVGYRCEPLRDRPGDPADWFSSTVHGDPGTPLPRAYPGEPIRIRLYQGAGRGQHGFVGHGLRWPARPGDPSSPWRNQRPVGPAQAFDLHLAPADGPGDRLWSFAANDDTWQGGWGLVRVHAARTADLPPLPSAFGRAGLPPFDPAAARRYHVRVRATPLRYSDSRADPHGLAYTVDGAGDGPLVLRARAGEWVEVTLTNELSGPPPSSPFDPRLPGADDPGGRVVSDRVSLQAGALRYDPCESDGAFAGTNPDTTTKPGHSVTYRWFADTPGAVLLSDRADVRTHRHRGLVGVLVVEPSDATPHDPSGTGDGWVGERAVVRRPGRPAEHELVLLLTDGLRLYHDGDPDRPVSDLCASGDGQMAFNHRSAHLRPDRPSLAVPRPPTPVLACAPGDALRLHLVVGADRARGHSFTVHGHSLSVDGDARRTPGDPSAVRGDAQPTVGALSAGSVRDLTLTAGAPGDYAYRSGAVRWALTEGLWGLIRVR